MGKRGGKRFGGSRGGSGSRGGGGGGGRRPRVDYTDVPKHNALFESYYSQLNILDEAELEELWTALRLDLPNSFRFTGSKGHALSVQQRLKDHYIPQITSIEYEGQAVAPPYPLPWFPNQLAWQMTTPKNIVRRFAPFASFQKFLVSETTVGNISRQEVVSMIPPLVMAVKPGMTVLDLCAAPGSKTAQLIEMVHGGEEARVRKVIRDYKQSQGRSVSPDGDEIKQEIDEEEQDGDWSDDGRSTGLVIANDVDYKRAHMLIHQAKRLNSPNLIVTNHDATQYPSIKLRSRPATEGQKQPPARYLKFDRILADVPCSGDGTARKNYNIWKEWKPANAVGLHVVQERILVRSLQMLKAGGRVVYSTCSMNPIENEAVIAAAIDRCGGSSKVEIVDTSAALPKLHRKPGLTTWVVMDKSGETWESWDVLKKHMDEHGSDFMGKLAPSMFPPVDGSEDIHLERCMRVYAHQQNTGSFFIAVLEKKVEIRARPEAEPKDASDEQESKPLPPISAAIKELESKTNGNNPAEHIEALDALPQPERNFEDNSSAAARLNGADMPEDVARPKRQAEDEDNSAESIAKRLKLEENDGTGDVPAEEESKMPGPLIKGDEDKETRPLPMTSNRVRHRGVQFEEPFKYLDPKHDILDSITTFYDLNPRFPRDRFLVRNATGEPSKIIYYSSALAKEILTENEGRGIKFIHCGVKVFVRQDVQSPEVCRWRIQNEGLPIVEAWVGENRVVRLYSRKTFRQLLIEMFPKLSGGAWQNLGDFGKLARDFSMGCCVLRIEKGEGEDGFSERIVLPIWRSLHSLNLMLPKEDRKAMLLRLYNDETPLRDHHHHPEKEAVARSPSPENNDDVAAAEEEVTATRRDEIAPELAPPDAGEDGVVPLNGADENGDVEIGEANGGS